MSKMEEYTRKAAESLAAVEASSNERDRQFHRRAHAVWRRLIAGIGEAEERAAMRPPPTRSPVPRGARAVTTPLARK